jgi:asparagine synthase (glutamine-hydrolysing)
MVSHFWGAGLAALSGEGSGRELEEAQAELESLLRFPGSANAGAVAKAQWIDAARGYLAGDILPKVDLASMSKSLEVRCPLLDHALAEVLKTLPDELRLRGSRGKILLRAIALQLLPEHIVERRKLGFSVPIRGWLCGGLRPLVEEHLASPNAPIAGLVDGAEVRKRSAPPRTDEDARLQFTLLSLGVWASQHR